MNLLLIGVSHKSAPVEVRERFALSERRTSEALRKLVAEPEFEEALILSTCNRVEFVLKVRGEMDAMAGLRRFFLSLYGLHYDDLAHYFYVFRDYEAARHLFRVAAGLDSMLVGEPQVLGQVKRAYFLAKEAEAAAGVLDAVLHRAFSVAKRVRTETSIGQAPVSISSAAVDLAEKALGSLESKSVMILGSGQMGELAARHLVAKGAKTIFVSNRTYARAEALAHELRGLAVRFNEIWTMMAQADVVISSTGCPHQIVTREDVERLMAERHGRPLFLIDIAVPRDIDPQVREVPGCTLVNIDDLQRVAHENLAERLKAAEAADRIIEEEMALFRARQAALDVVPTIVSLRERCEQIRKSELARTRHLFGRLTPEQERALEILTKALVNKLLHTPFTELKQAASRPGTSDFVEVVRTIFHLEAAPRAVRVSQIN